MVGKPGSLAAVIIECLKRSLWWSDPNTIEPYAMTYEKPLLFYSGRHEDLSTSSNSIQHPRCWRRYPRGVTKQGQQPQDLKAFLDRGEWDLIDLGRSCDFAHFCP